MREATTGRVRSFAFRAGQIVWLPPGASWLNRHKARPFVVTAAPAALSGATLAYGSTREAEKSLGAACIEVAPQRQGVNRNGLWIRTLFYPGILLRRDHALLPAPAGSLGRAMNDFKTCLLRALGIGQGSCSSGGAPAGSRRGRIVELQPALSGMMQTRFAVLLTDAEYSRSKNYQIILPIVPGDGKAAAESVLQIQAREWMSVFRRRPRSVLFPIPIVQSVWHDAHIARETEHVVDEETLHEIDRRLCDYFSLEPPDEGC